jgi:hypothetical protein
MKDLPHRSRLLTPLLLAGLLALGRAGAVPLDYREAVQGDLPDSGVLPVLELDLGSNQVLGTLAVRDAEPEPQGDFDHFAFTVAAGQQLVGISIQLTDVLGNIAWGRWSLWQAQSATLFDGAELGVKLIPPSPGQAAEAGGWGPGLYQLEHENMAWYPGDQVPLHTADYRIELSVRPFTAPVPEPATWAMAAAGLALLRLRRRPGVHR